MCSIEYECRAGIKFLARADGGESYEFGADVDAVSARMVMSADYELDHSASLVSDDGKNLVGIVYDMSLLNAYVKTLMAKYPETAALGSVQKDLAQSLDLVGGDICILPIILDAAAVARTVRAIIGIKEDEIDLSRTANEGRADKIRYTVKGIVVEILEIVISLHNENGDRAVAYDLRYARKMLDIIRAADTTVYNVAEADREINADIFKIKKKLLQLSERTRGETVVVCNFFPSAMKVGKKSNFHLYSPCVDRI
jgi:hypothetical protein